MYSKFNAKNFPPLNLWRPRATAQLAHMVSLALDFSGEILLELRKQIPVLHTVDVRIKRVENWQ